MRVCARYNDVCHSIINTKKWKDRIVKFCTVTFILLSLSYVVLALLGTSLVPHKKSTKLHKQNKTSQATIGNLDLASYPPNPKRIPLYDPLIFMVVCAQHARLIAPPVYLPSGKPLSMREGVETQPHAPIRSFPASHPYSRNTHHTHQ